MALIFHLTYKDAWELPDRLANMQRRVWLRRVSSTVQRMFPSS